MSIPQTLLHPLSRPGRNLAVRSHWLLTMTPGRELIRDGMVVFREDTILAAGPYSELKNQFQTKVHDLEGAVLAPGVINAHTHLELSHLAGRIPPGGGFEAWVGRLVTLPLKDVPEKLLQRTVSDLVSCGTAYVADITGHSHRLVHDTLLSSPLGCRLFVEFFGFRHPGGNTLNWPATVRPSSHSEVAAAGHALYSTHPSTLQLAKTWSSRRRRPFSMHLSEHAGEVEFLATGRGSFAGLIKERLVPGDFIPPGVSPVAYADRLGLLDERTLAVHCVHLSQPDIETLAGRQVSVCLCPRSNAFIGVGRAPWERLAASGVRLCLGSDSLASNTDLDLWNEAVYVARHWEQGLPLTKLAALVTRNPASALGIEDRYGSLEPGKKARFSLVPERLLDECELT
ncbi:MAG: amidohydrolase family protein [Desulfohalobiaceae bacterium]